MNTDDSRTRRGQIVRYVVIAVLTLVSALVMSDVAGWAGTWWGVLLGILVAVALLVGMRWRQSHPVLLAVLATLAAAAFPALWAVAAWAYLSLATHRKWRATLGVGLLSLVLAVWVTVGQEPGFVVEDTGRPIAVAGWVEFLAIVVFNAIFLVALAAIGSYLGARRQERQALADRVAAAEREQVLVQDAARAEERNRIAREMHDVLAHKISLISMHAGAMAFRDDLSADETRQAARTIQESSHEALNELRLILGQLRQLDDGGAAKPQPTLAALESLVSEHRAAGGRIQLDNLLDWEPSPTISRHAYRVVQESLTNAAKHAPGTTVAVHLSGSPDRGLAIRVTNPLSVGPGSTPGAGLGLMGLEERVHLVGGRMQASPADGEFLVDVWLPWDATRP